MTVMSSADFGNGTLYKSGKTNQLVNRPLNLDDTDVEINFALAKIKI